MASTAVAGLDTLIADRAAEFGVPESAVLDAVLVCVGRFGLAKTTLDDIAREAGVSRATVYRLFPGGKAVVLEATAIRELARILDEVDGRIRAATGWTETLAAAMSSTYDAMMKHPTLAGLMAVEPTAIAPYLAFDRIEPVLECAIAVLAPSLEPELGVDRARQVVAWGVRVLLSYLLYPEAGSDALDLARPHDVERLIATYLAPGIDAARRHTTEKTTAQRNEGVHS